MTQLSAGNSVSLWLDVSDTLTVANGTVIGPGGPVTVTTAQTFGPYAAGAMIRVIGGSGCEYTFRDLTTAAERSILGSGRAIVLGDSYADLSLVTSAIQNDYPFRSELALANVELGFPWDIVANNGATGETAAQIALRASAAIAASDPEWVLIPGGAFINSVGTDVEYSSIIASLESIFAACAGRRVLWCTASPASNKLTTEARKQTWAKVNRWALNRCRELGFIGVDTASPITSATTGLEASTMLTDTLHPSGIGASRMARAIVRAVNRVGVISSVPWVSADSFDRNNLVYNPYAAGSNAGGSGGYTAGGLTGSAGPDGWEGTTHASGAGVVSKVASDDENLTDWARIAVTSAAALSGAGWIFRFITSTTWAITTAYQVGTRRVPTVANGYIYRVIVAGTSGASEPTWPTTVGASVTDGSVTWACYKIPAPGDVIRAAAEFRLSSWTGAASVGMYVECLDSGSATLTQSSCLMNRNDEAEPTYVIPSGVLLTPALTIPANTTQVNLRIRTYGAGSITGNLDMRRVRCWLV